MTRKVKALAERERIRLRLVKSGAMAAMRRALEACPDAGRTETERARAVSPERELAVGLLIGMANAERDLLVDGEALVAHPLGGRRGECGSRLIRYPLIVWHTWPCGTKF